MSDQTEEKLHFGKLMGFMLALTLLLVVLAVTLA